MKDKKGEPPNTGKKSADKKETTKNKDKTSTGKGTPRSKDKTEEKERDKKGRKEKATSKSRDNANTKPTQSKTESRVKSNKDSPDRTLILEEDDVEGMTVPPRDLRSGPWSDQPRVPDPAVSPSAPRRPTATPGTDAGPRRPQPQQSQPTRRPEPRPGAGPADQRRPQGRPAPWAEEEEDEESAEEDDEEEEVKQFSFPAYKILSGASVAPVKMYPQKIVIQKNEGAKRHWATGLFQNSKLTLKLRLLRLFLIWIFFRVLNKQTAWVSDALGIGIPDEKPPGPSQKAPPGERFIRVFREGDPNPFHVRVKKNM